MAQRETFRALFDAAHGQPNWAQTGFSSRQLGTTFSGLASILTDLKCDCVEHAGGRLAGALGGVDLLVIPPPTGLYNARTQAWQPESTSYFSSDELYEISRFLHHGGRLLAFSYRFGDSFTQGNLGDLFASLGVVLNNDAVINLDNIRCKHPLQSQFVTRPEFMSLPWESARIASVAWRSMATFLILPGTPAFPLAWSPGGRCIAYDRLVREISFQSQPILVAGTYGAGRFVLSGGPHAFECGPFGLLDATGNRPFLQRVLRWLVTDEPVRQDLFDPEVGLKDSDLARQINSNWQRLCQLKAGGADDRLIRQVERQLRETGLLRAINRARWSA